MAEASLRRVLVVRAGALGDLILLRTTLASLRGAGASVTLLAPSGPARALAGEVDRLAAWEGTATARAMAGDPGDLREALGTFDLALCYSRSEDMARALRSLAVQVVVHDPEPVGMHASAWMAQPLHALGIPRIDPGLMLPGAEDIRAAVPWLDRLAPRFLAIHPGSGSPRKNWPADRFAELARTLSCENPWLLCLGPADEAAAPLATAPLAVAARDVPLPTLGALLSRAGLYVGNDSGVSHLAAALGVSTVALFGPTDPGLWSPVGRRVQTLRAPDGRLSSLGADEVTSAATFAAREPRSS